jgi:diacylglycerol kinase
MKPFIDAFRGVAVMIATQKHARYHLGFVLFVVAFGIGFKIEPLEWCAVLLAMGLVLAAEALNTAIEFLADAVHPEHHPLVGKSKDVAAGGVLLAAIAAAAVGLIVFVPKILAWIAPN